MISYREDILDVMRKRPGRAFYIIAALAIAMMLTGVYCAWQTVHHGVGLWGINNQHNWGVSIVNFVWWVGLGHAGTFISAVLLLLNQNWRTPVFRLAETITLFSILCAAFFPVIHLGRHALFFYIFPYLNTRGLIVNFSSPLFWDMAAIFVYLIVSALFWYSELVPDLYILNKYRLNRLHLPVFNWNNTFVHQQIHRRLTFFIASLATPLVISVHSVVSMDFAVALLPGWHSYLFPPFFVAGAVFSGFAMVQICIVIAREVFSLQRVIGLQTLEIINRLLLAFSLIILACYITEVVFAFLPAGHDERKVIIDRLTGQQAPAFYTMLCCNCLLPLILIWRKARQSTPVTVGVSAAILSGMWLERWVIINGSLSIGFFRISSVQYSPTLTEMGLLAGSIGFFVFMMLFAFRYIPIVSIYESENMHDYSKKQ